MVNMYHDISILCFVDFMIDSEAYKALKMGEL